MSVNGQKKGGLYDLFVKIGEMQGESKNNLLWNYHCLTEQAIHLVVSHLEFYITTF